MTTGPLPPELARQVHGYLAALVPPGELDDAWHDVTGELRYWGDRDAATALHVAHAVVGQRLRVSDEAATLVLVEELGIEDVSLVAAVLDRDVADVQGLVGAVQQELAGHGARGSARDADGPGDLLAAAPAAPSAPAGAASAADRAAWASVPEPTVDQPGDDRDDTATRPAVRIGFDEPAASADPGDYDAPTPPPGPWLSPRTRVLVAWAVVIWVVIAVLVWLDG